MLSIAGLAQIYKCWSSEQWEKGQPAGKFSPILSVSTRFCFPSCMLSLSLPLSLCRLGDALPFRILPLGSRLGTLSCRPFQKRWVREREVTAGLLGKREGDGGCKHTSGTAMSIW